MHVLFIVSWYKTPARPLAGTFFEEQARALMKMGVKVGMLYPDIDMRFGSRFRRLSGNLPTDFVDNGLPTLYHFVKSIVPRNRSLNYLYLGVTTFSKFRNYVKEHGKPDLIHAHCVFNAGIVARYISSRFKIPYVVTEHYSGIVSDAFKINFNKRIATRVYNSSSRSIAVSHSFANDIVTKYQLDRKKIDVIPNMVNSIFFNNDRKFSRSNGYRIFTNSFLTQIKNHKLLFQAFKYVNDRMPGSMLVVGGDGILMGELKSVASELKLDNQILFLGALTRDQVKDELNKSDLFVSSSRYETFGVAILEALACGKPVVSTNSGGPADIMTADNGILVDEHTPKALSEAILNVLNNYNKYDSALIQKDCMERFGEENVMSKIHTVYKQVIL